MTTSVAGYSNEPRKPLTVTVMDNIAIALWDPAGSTSVGTVTQPVSAIEAAKAAATGLNDRPNTVSAPMGLRSSRAHRPIRAHPFSLPGDWQNPAIEEL